jgi:hypothetical protein
MRNLKTSSYAMGQEIWTITEKKLVEKDEYEQTMELDANGWPFFRVTKKTVQVMEEVVSPPFMF